MVKLNSLYVHVILVDAKPILCNFSHKLPITTTVHLPIYSGSTNYHTKVIRLFMYSVIKIEYNYNTQRLITRR